MIFVKIIGKNFVSRKKNFLTASSGNFLKTLVVLLSPCTVFKQFNFFSVQIIEIN